MMNIILPHYECEVKKITLFETNKKEKNTATITANKIYINSINKSNNINNDVEIFNKMIVNKNKLQVVWRDGSTMEVLK